MSTIKHGNFGNENTANKGWIIGPFIDPNSPFHTDKFEVKFVERKAGDASTPRPGISSDHNTITMLIEGSVEFKFVETGETYTLKTSGDYVYFQPNISHTAKAIVDSKLLIIRW